MKEGGLSPSSSAAPPPLSLSLTLSLSSLRLLFFSVQWQVGRRGDIQPPILDPMYIMLPKIAATANSPPSAAAVASHKAAVRHQPPSAAAAAQVDEMVVRVGYVVKPSRQADFVKRGAFPETPTENGLTFVPVMFNRPLEFQLQGVDVILHKATDEIVAVEPSGSTCAAMRITFSEGMNELLSYLEGHPDYCVIDPIDKIYPLLDRQMMQQILLELEDISTGTPSKIRAPRFLKVDTFDDPDLAENLSDAKMCLPAIIKPQIACGVSHAHSMAIVFEMEDFPGLPVPVPAIIQSTPNASVLSQSSANSGSRAIVFDSLKSLPTEEKPNADIGSSAESSKPMLDVELVSSAAIWMKQRLGLTIFGFDVVVQLGTGDHVIVDVNYLPSFKEVPDGVAVPAFWKAIRSAYDSRKAK
ncbi:Inositol 1-3-4-trisphosphate 5/6-kinase 4 [Nymphaea thermarum]|nr:Inositol 1-3-4-trisphosphate 5/6-kinase 4 [Nymphaea thermarum]